MIKLFTHFLRNAWGTVQYPYKTYRTITKESAQQLIYIFLAVGIYFFLSAPLRVGMTHPFYVTINALKLSGSAFFSFLLVISLIYAMGALYKTQSSISSIINCWGYSLLPTLIWFWATALFYFLLPPPRNNTVPGVAFSILYISFSAALLWWKGMLYYLTLRFALKFDMKKIVITSLVIIPTIFIYSMILYKIGIYKIPFI